MSPLAEQSSKLDGGFACLQPTLQSRPLLLQRELVVELDQSHQPVCVEQGDRERLLDTSCPLQRFVEGSGVTVIRALCGKGGSVPYWYDIAGAIPVALGRGLRVILTDAQERLLTGGNHDIYTPVAFVVARPEVEAVIVDAIRSTINPGF